MSNAARLSSLILLLLLLLGCASAEHVAPVPSAPPVTAPAIATAPLDAEIPVDPALLYGRLENGLSYYIRKNQRPEKRAELRLVLNAGSLQEDDDQRGLAHFVEHMAFNGTRHFEKQELTNYLEKIGMQFGADLNAFTSFDETVYQLTVPTDDPEVFATAFQILEDWAHGITFDPEEVDKERGVVIEEWRLGRGAQARLRDKQFPILFQGSRYAERLPIGKTDILQNAPAEALKRFYRDWYRPDLMAVVAVGDFDPEGVRELVREYLGRVPERREKRPRETWRVPDHAETLWSIETDPELSNTLVLVYTLLPPLGQGTFGDYRRSLVEGLYAGMLNARLGEIAQRPDPPFLFGYSSLSNLVRSRGAYVQGAAVRDGEVARGLEAVLLEAERVDRHGFAASELDRAKLNLLRDYEQAFRERDKVPSAALGAECSRHFLEGEPVPGLEAELALVERFLPAITLEEVNRLAKSWITEENRVILVSGPESEDVPPPSREELLAAFEAASKAEVEPWVDEARDEPLVAEAPEPAEVVETSSVDEIGVTVWRLANGVRVVLKPTDFKNDQVLLAGFSPGGDSLAPDADHTSATFATAIVAESGYGEFSSIELGKALAGKVAGGGPYVSELEEGFRGSASPEDLETLFQLLYLAFTAPRFDPEAYESLQSRWHTLIENRSNQPETVFRDALAKVLSQDHPRRRPLSPELLDEIAPERALAFYRDRFADAADFTFVMVGNFVPEKVRPLVETWLGGLPATGREESWRDVGVEAPSGFERVEVRKGLEPKSQVRMIFSGPAAWSREEQHDVQALAQVLRIRLREVLREDLGATYGVGVSGGITQRPREEYGFTVSFGCDPGEVENLVAAVRSEVEAIQDGDEEALEAVADALVKVKEAIRRQREIDLKENGFWLGVLENTYTFGHDPLWILDFVETFDQVTVERVREAARRYLDPERHVLGVLYPEDRTHSATK